MSAGGKQSEGQKSSNGKRGAVLKRKWRKRRMAKGAEGNGFPTFHFFQDPEDNGCSEEIIV
jgi:hypothetical protein